MNSNEGKQKFFVVYQITNLLDNRIYVGIHCTYNVNDRYMGSSKYLKKDIKELGRQNFRKDILHVFDNKEDMIKKEAEIVNREFCHRPDTYNRMEGGGTYLTLEMVSVKDSEGNCMKVYRDDPRYLSNELISVTKGTVMVRDYEGKIFRVSKDDSRYLSGELVSNSVGKINVKDKNGDKFQIDRTDKRWLTGELVGYNKGFYNKGFDWTGKKHSEESKQKIGKSNSVSQKGEKNSQYGTCWITNGTENKKIKKELLEEYIEQGYSKGRV